MRKVYYIIGLLILNMGCQKEPLLIENEGDYNESGVPEDGSREIIMRSLDYRELKEKLEVISVLEKFSGSTEKANESTEIYYKTLDLYIQINNVTQIQKEDFESYTFAIRRDGFKSIRNLVIYRENGEDYKATLVTYNLDVDDLNNSSQEALQNSIVSYTDINMDDLATAFKKMTYECNEVWVYDNSICSIDEGELIGAHECEGEWVMESRSCGYVGGGGPVTTDPDPTNVDPTNPNTGSGSNSSQSLYITYTPPTLITSPTLSYEETILRNIVRTGMSLTTEQRDYLLLYDQFSLSLLNFLQDNAADFENAEVFGIAAVNAKMAGGEVNFNQKIIFTSNVKDCVKEIIKKMLNDNEYLDLGDMPEVVKQELNLSGYILDIFNHSDKYSLIFDSAPNLVNNLGQAVNAKTTTIRNPSILTSFNSTITLNSNYINNATDIAVARTIIHETLHAFISYIYQEQILSTLSQSLTLLLQASGATQGSAQHNLMSQQFVNAISNSLKSWDNSSLSNHQYYKYLSWSGNMLSSPAFNALTEDEKQLIQDANIAEGSALSLATGLAKGTNNCN